MGKKQMANSHTVEISVMNRMTGGGEKQTKISLFKMWLQTATPSSAHPKAVEDVTQDGHW